MRQSHTLTWSATRLPAESIEESTTVERHRTVLPAGFLREGHGGARLCLVRGHPHCQGNWCLQFDDGPFVHLVTEDAPLEAAKVFAVSRARDLSMEAA